MQNELNANYPELAIQILGINETGHESGNPFIIQERDIPWLQDVDEDKDGESDVWTSWAVTFRDVVIVDFENVAVESFNLTTYPLGILENYQMLMQLLIENALIPGDVNLDGEVNFLDIDPFIVLLTSGDYQIQADINQDGVVDFLDIQPFVALLN